MKKKTTEQFIEEAIAMHGDKYSYDKSIYRGAHALITITCPLHGDFEQRARHHLDGKQCSSCTGNRKLTTEEFVNRARKLHDGYDYSKVKYENSNKKVIIRCKIHGNFRQFPYHHLNGNGCPKCHHVRLKFIQTNSHSDFVSKANDVHGNTYQYIPHDDFNGSSKTTIQCNKHGVFHQLATNHLRGSGCPACANKISQPQIDIANQIRSLGLTCFENHREIIPPYELDIYVPELFTAIEYCGLRWHSETFGKKTRNYHINKLKLCGEAGVRLITIFEDEWINKTEIVKRRLNHILTNTNNKIYARKCQIREITKEVAKQFLDIHHLQGYSGCKYRYGLYHGGELVSVMTFSKPNISKGSRGNSEGIYEINRFASSIIVVGGASKLLNHFATNLRPNKVISYCDLRWSTGNLYHKMGMSLVRTSAPNYWYIDKQFRIHRFALRKGNIPTDDPKLTEWENRKLQGYDRIWDCGNLVFEKQY